ncbi:hypothetical protein [Clostridium sp. 001]|uniref:hypothetical protein n=1 Tax=Clostridium sp. 001 TaxID=1970093 RepID=UPI001C2B8289|nr:hypothetical protein [Clostridium sp. 001]
MKCGTNIKVGINELIAVNLEITNPAMIIPWQKIFIPNIDVKAMQNQIIPLVNQPRISARPTI